MAVSVFTRFGNIRNVMNINNISAIGGMLNIKQHSNVTFKSYSTDVKEIDILVDNVNVGKQSDKRMSKAMEMYLNQSLKYQKFIKEENIKFEVGKRHLANIMGEDPDNFTQSDIDRAIAYLLPSGLFDWRARPLMRDPNELFEKRKEAAFDETGRPHHFLFYTCKANYYDILHNIAETLICLNEMEDKMIATKKLPSTEDKLNVLGTDWLSKEEFQSKLVENLQDSEYEYLIKSLNRVIEHPMSKHKASFIMNYRKKLITVTENLILPPLSYDKNGRPFIVIYKCQKKTAFGQVKVIGKGSGNIIINGQDISYFSDIQSREQIIFPLIFTEMSDKVDIEATISGGGPSGQVAAIRWGIARGLRNFVDIKMIERMRVAGLLTRDRRRRERKKWGQEGARRKFTWSKR